MQNWNENKTDIDRWLLFWQNIYFEYVQIIIENKNKQNDNLHMKILENRFQKQNQNETQKRNQIGSKNGTNSVIAWLLECKYGIFKCL